MRKADAARVLDVLVAAPLFRGLPSRRLQQLLAASSLERYTADQVIVSEGTLGDAFYVVIRGGVAVQTSHLPGEVTRLAGLGPGDYFGEMALLSGRPRVADVIAQEDSEVLAIPRGAFEAQLLGDAWFKARLAEQSQERETDLLRQRVARILHGVPLFASLRWEELARVAATAEIATLEKGAIICRQGEQGGALYVVLSGEVEVRVASGGTERVVTSLREGASFGEMSLLTGDPVSATLEVILDCTLLVLDKPHFQALLDYAPFARNMSQILSERLRDQTATGLVDGGGVGGAVVAVASAEPGLGKTTLAVNLAASLAHQVGTVALVDLDPACAACRYLGLDDVPAPSGGDELDRLRKAKGGLVVLPLPEGGGTAPRLRLARVLGTLKERYRYVVVDTTERAPEPTGHSTVLADALVFLTRGGTPLPELAGNVELLQVYAPDADPAIHAPPVGGRVFRLPPNRESVERFYRGGRPFVLAEPRSFLGRAIGRIARYLTRQQVGLVLAGGAAWGPGQAGVLAGLEERGADIDLIAATGMGSLLGAAYAAGLPVQALERLALAFHSPWEDLLAAPAPRRADLARAKRLRHLLHTVFGSTELGAVHVPLWLSAADADTGEEVVLRTGRLVDALAATIGLPGLARTRRRDGRNLVDGSVVAPVPLHLAREMGADVLVAVAAGLEPGVTMPHRRRRASTGRREAPLRLVMLILRLASHRLAAVSAESADLVIAPRTGSPVRDGRGRALLELGRAAAADAVPVIADLQAARLGSAAR